MFVANRYSNYKENEYFLPPELWELIIKFVCIDIEIYSTSVQDYYHIDSIERLNIARTLKESPI